MYVCVFIYLFLCVRLQQHHSWRLNVRKQFFVWKSCHFEWNSMYDCTTALYQVTVSNTRRNLQQSSKSNLGCSKHKVSKIMTTTHVTEAYRGVCNSVLNLFYSFIRRYSRLISPKYGDGYSAPSISVTGQELPNSRLVSLVAFGEDDVADPQFTLVNMQWGQIVTHDMSMLAGSTQSSKITKSIH